MHNICMFLLGPENALPHDPHCRIVIAKTVCELITMVNGNALGNEDFTNHVNEALTLSVL